MKIDLHCHSKYSRRPTLWLMQKLNCPESFTEPRALYRRAREMGMDYVTITDHNEIDGALEIAELPNTVLGCEYTTYFPEDRCKIHVLVYGMTEAQHRELNEVRENIFEFTSYLQDRQLKHVCAHPFFWINDRLTVEHVEQLVLLYKNWEWNGDMVHEMNVAVMELVTSLTPQKIAELSNKHGFEPSYEQPWKKNVTAGSDDHSSLHLAQTYTEVPDAHTWEEFWLGVEHNHAKVVYQPATPEMFARNAYGTGFQFYTSKFGLDRHVNTDTMLRFLNRVLTSQPNPSNAWLTKMKRFLVRKFRGPGEISPRSSLMDMARKEAESLIKTNPRLARIVEQGSDNSADLDQVCAEFVGEVSNRILAHIGQHTIERIQHARVFDLLQSMGTSAALYSLITPYFVSYSLFAKERAWSAELMRKFGLRAEANSAQDRPRVAHFTDTLDEVNGVAVTLQQEIEAAGRLEHDISILTCSATPRPPRQHVYRFAPLASHSIPEYAELAIHVPPFLKLLKHCYDQRYTHIHVATPGTMGLAGMAIARILHLPLTGTYHTAFPQYARALTEDLYVEQMMWTGMMWFYAQLDAVYVPSHATGADLIARGLSAEKIRVYPRGVDTVRFSPSKASPALREELGVGADTPMLLYVGRVSKEKNLPVLVDAMNILSARNLDFHLVVVGDGPYRDEMEKKLTNVKATFTGYQSGEQLTHLFASADAFVLPSTTDTFGNVVLEAQASGLPVIVSNVGGPREMIEPGATGLIVSSMTGAAFAEAIAYLLGDPELRKAMGHAARAVTETRGIDACVNRLWEMYGEDEQRRPAGGARPPHSVAMPPFPSLQSAA